MVMSPRALKMGLSHVDKCEYSFSERRGCEAGGLFLTPVGGEALCYSVMLQARKAASLESSLGSSTDNFNVMSVQLILTLDILFPDGVKV